MQKAGEAPISAPSAVVAMGLPVVFSRYSPILKSRILEDEVAEECTKLYGHVVRVKIFEPADRAAPPLVFVEFDGPGAAARAEVGLDGRRFGGRAVRAKRFDFSRYQRNELAVPHPREPG